MALEFLEYKCEWEGRDVKSTAHSAMMGCVTVCPRPWKDFLLWQSHPPTPCATPAAAAATPPHRHLLAVLWCLDFISPSSFVAKYLTTSALSSQAKVLVNHILVCHSFKMLEALRSLDGFHKTVDDFRKKTVSGGLGEIILQLHSVFWNRTHHSWFNTCILPTSLFLHSFTVEHGIDEFFLLFRGVLFHSNGMDGDEWNTVTIIIVITTNINTLLLVTPLTENFLIFPSPYHV